jgi:hypothetical protein
VSVTAVPPPFCPHCGSLVWEYVGCGRAVRLSVRWAGRTIYVLTPQGEFDAPSQAAVCGAVAALVYEQPEIVLDLRELAQPEECTADLLLRLAALAQEAGGRLLAPCPAGERSTLGFSSLAGDGRERAGGDVARALNTPRRRSDRRGKPGP